ncbi:MAG: helix-turn-helix domain-containing protein, partial [Chloroflexota bacterium]
AELRAEVAERYAEWVRSRLKRHGFNAAVLSRRSGLSKQTISAILNADISQPTAWQIAALSRVFGVEPSEIFEEIGLWSKRAEHVRSRELSEAYRSLGFPARRALLANDRILREMEAAYEISETPPLDLAALRSTPADEEMRRQVERGEEAEPGWE